MASLQNIIDKVTEQETVVDSVVALLGEIKTKLDAAISGGADPAELQRIADSIGAQTQELSDAVVANTPAENL